MCGAKLAFPDKPERRKVGRIEVLGNVPCPKCPAVMTVREDNGFIVGFTPNQPMTVRKVK